MPVPGLRALNRGRDAGVESVSCLRTVAYLLSRANAASGGRELRGMAARMGLPH